MTPNTTTVTQDGESIALTEAKELSLSDRLKILADEDFVEPRHPPTGTLDDSVSNKRKSLKVMSVDESILEEERRKVKKQKPSVEAVKTKTEQENETKKDTKAVPKVKKPVEIVVKREREVGEIKAVEEKS